VTRPAIEVRGLTVSLGGCAILEDVSCTVPAGQLLAIVGPNGAGKSTLLRCLDGLVSAQAGDVLIDGRPLGDRSRRELARTVSYVPQTDARWVELSVEAFVEMGRYPYLGAWAALDATDTAAVRQALRDTETEHLAPRSLTTLSGGERQGVLIAAALAQGGNILLLDEPTTYLDFRHQTQVLGLLRRLHTERGLTIVVVTHDLNGVVAAADSVLALKQGRVVFAGSPAALLTETELSHVFDTGFLLVPAGERELPLVLPLGEGA